MSGPILLTVNFRMHCVCRVPGTTFTFGCRFRDWPFDQALDEIWGRDSPVIRRVIMKALARTTQRPTAVWVGRILTGVAVLFMIFDGVTKLMKVPQVVEATTVQLGFPESSLVGIGLLLLGCIAVYIVPRRRD
jgi:hypothetical protein